MFNGGGGALLVGVIGQVYGHGVVMLCSAGGVRVGLGNTIR